MKMNPSIPPGFHSEEPNAPKFVQTSLFKGTQENLAVIQMLHNMNRTFSLHSDEMTNLNTLKTNQTYLLL